MTSYIPNDLAPRHEEYRIFGPPGTGKTTTASKWIRRAAEVNGSAAVLVASFTKAAAVELAGRDLPIGKDQIGTLHAHGYRALGKPPVVGKEVEDWNERFPEWRMTGERGDRDEPEFERVFGAAGDEVFARYDHCRSLMLPREAWPGSVQAFASHWEAWKEGIGAIDFTDMIELALREYPIAPGNPSVGFFDEVQDCTPLELALIRSWARPMEYVVLLGDDDQAIYGFRGATPDAFLSPPVDEAHKRVLAQSYRVPRRVQDVAQGWIERVGRREPKEYKPRDVEGEVRHLRTVTWKSPEGLVRDADRYLQDGKTVAFLGSCSFLLRPLISVLRKEGIPFHNPWNRRRGDWNPLRPSKGTGSAERLLSFLAPEMYGSDIWAPGDFKRWAEVLKSEGVLERGAKAEIASLSDERGLELGDLRRWFTPEAFKAAASLDVDWFERSLLAAKVKGMSFPLQILRRRGTSALKEKPRVIVSTIHACKGGEADVVYVLPDLSRAGMLESMGSGRDSIIRLFYVAMTRAKESLILCAPASPCAVRVAA
jgi:hypothetical protein